MSFGSRLYGLERSPGGGLCERSAQKKRRRRVPASASTRLEAAAGAAVPQCRQQQPNYVSYARRATKAIDTR